MSLAGNTKHNEPNWDVFDELFAAYSELTDTYYSEFDDLIKIWDDELSEFDQDPTHTDWTKFRPLRLSREEDWSDWLGYLIETSNTGMFAKLLLDIPEQKQSAYALPLRVDREVSHDEYRADIVVQWTNHNCTHIEVKVGDENLAKTGATASRMRAYYQQSERNWTNFILMLSEQLSDWDSSNNNQPGEPHTKTITWVDVSIALRRALRSEETLLWRSWAYSYLGAIEQHLVGFPGHRLNARPIENLNRKIQIMKMGLEHEPAN
jgi:hypothetical protein